MDPGKGLFAGLNTLRSMVAMPPNLGMLLKLTDAPLAMYQSKTVESGTLRGGCEPEFSPRKFPPVIEPAASTAAVMRLDVALTDALDAMTVLLCTVAEEKLAFWLAKTADFRHVTGWAEGNSVVLTVCEAFPLNPVPVMTMGSNAELFSAPLGLTTFSVHDPCPIVCLVNQLPLLLVVRQLASLAIIKRPSSIAESA